MNNLPGIKTKPDYVAAPSKFHKHTWHRVEKNIPGAVLYIFVCVDHMEGDKKKPVWETYDMVVNDPDQFMGQSEYETKKYGHG